MATQTFRAVRTGSYIWAWWLAASLAGFVGGMMIKTAIEISADIGGFTAVLEAIPAPVFGLLFGLMLGGCIGLAQWLVLRRRLAGVGRWAPATLAAYMIFWFLHNGGVFGFAQTPWGLVGQGFGHGAIIGAMVGAAQYLVLRPRVAWAGRWAALSTISWSLAGAIMHFLLDVAFASANIHGPFDVLISTLLAGLFLGLALEQLLGSDSSL